MWGGVFTGTHVKPAFWAVGSGISKNQVAGNLGYSNKQLRLGYAYSWKERMEDADQARWHPYYTMVVFCP